MTLTDIKNKLTALKPEHKKYETYCSKPTQ